MRWTSILLSLAVVAGLALWFWPERETAVAANGPAGAEAGAGPAVSAAAREERPVPVMVLTVEAEPAATDIVLRGRTRANRSVDVEAETEGLVISEPRRRGSEVEAGDLLCRIDPGSRAAQLREAEARLAEAQAEADAAESLSAKGFTAETTRIARNAELEAAQAAIDLIRLDIARLEIRAPFAGVLDTDTAELGSRLAIGEICATVTDLSTIRASGFVTEEAVDRIRQGRPATVRLISGRVAEGTVSYVSRVADEQTRTYEVEVALPNEDGRLRDGMSAELHIPLPAVTAHRIPQSALTLDDDGRLGVRIAEDGHAVFVPVRVLRDQTDGIWVAGLPDVARVIVVGQEFVRDGRAIRAEAVSWGDLG